MSGKLAHFFLDMDMRCSHQGLQSILKKMKITIEDGDFIVFLNRRRNMIKMFCHGKEALLHYKKDDRQIDPGVIAYLPKYCGGNELDINGAIGEHLKDMLSRKRNRHVKKKTKEKNQIFKGRKKKKT